MSRHPRSHLAAFRAAAVVAALLATAGARADLPTAAVQRMAGGTVQQAEAVVEAVRQTAIAAQVTGAVVALPAHAGERVTAGQWLMRLDARAAEQNAAAGAEQVKAAQAALAAATQEFQRQQQLHEKRYISPAALERAEAQFKATQAQVQAQLAQAGAARTEAGFYTVRAPYAGLLADVPVSLGDMAMPGRVLAIVYDPAALRVRAAVPAAALPGDAAAAKVQVALDGRRIIPQAVEVLPAADAATHTVTVRATLPPGIAARPGQFARLVWTASGDPGPGRLCVPAQAIVRRAELTAVYVLDAQRRPVLRQVRLGPPDGDRIEVLSGLREGEAVVLTPQAATRQP